MFGDMNFPLVDSSYDNQEILRCIETLLGGQLTMGPRVDEFEKEFARYIGAPHAVMVNSGSSANLLAVSAIVNPVRRKHLKKGDAVAVPAVCWSTSLWPLVQLGLRPILIDVNPNTLNMCLDSLDQAMLRHNVRAILMVHVMGNSTEMGGVLERVEREDMLLIEDTCESLGAKFEINKVLGTLGDFGTYSFYFSHHMTTIEGGMVVAQTQEDSDLLRCLRSHGWSREQSNRTALEESNMQIDPRFLFVNVGFNLRPMEIQAAFGIEQLKRVEEMNRCRRNNFDAIQQALVRHPRWRGQLVFPVEPLGITASWFGFPFMVSSKEPVDLAVFKQKLLDCGIDTRPIVSGNMALQPAIKMFDIDTGLGPFTGAQLIHDRGLFIGVHSKNIDKQRIDWVAQKIILSLDQAII